MSTAVDSVSSPEYKLFVLVFHAGNAGICIKATSNVKLVESLGKSGGCLFIPAGACLFEVDTYIEPHIRRAIPHADLDRAEVKGALTDDLKRELRLVIEGSRQLSKSEKRGFLDKMPKV